MSVYGSKGHCSLSRDFEYIWEQLKRSGGLAPAVSLQDVFNSDMRVPTPPHSGEGHGP